MSNTGTISNAANRPLTFQQGSTPDVSGAMKDTLQSMTFIRVLKNTVGFQLVETPTPINFQGHIQPFTDRELEILDIGERAWSWFHLHADPVLSLNVDEVVNWLSIPTRVMKKRDYSLYGYVAYVLVQNWTGSGP